MNLPVLSWQKTIELAFATGHVPLSAAGWQEWNNRGSACAQDIAHLKNWAGWGAPKLKGSCTKNTGWWLTYPSEKYESHIKSLRIIIPNIWKKCSEAPTRTSEYICYPTIDNMETWAPGGVNKPVESLSPRHLLDTTWKLDTADRQVWLHSTNWLCRDNIEKHQEDELQCQWSFDDPILYDPIWPW